MLATSKVPRGTALRLRETMPAAMSMPWTWRALEAMAWATGLPVPEPQSRIVEEGGRRVRYVWMMVRRPVSWP